MKIAGMSALMVVALVASASAQEIEFDLFGIRIGDTFEKVETVLLNRGFRPPPATIFGTPPIRYGPTFEQAVALRRNEIEKQDATGAVAEANYLRGFDKVQVDFTPWPDGPAVTRVTYRPDIVIPDDCPGFREAFDARYSHGIAYKGRFCRKLRLCMESLLSPDTVIQRAPKIAGKQIVRVFRIVSCGSCARLQCHPVLRRLRGRI